MSRRYLIIASIAGHAALGVGIFISGIWKIERLDYQHRATLSLGALMPPGESGGGEGEKQEEKKADKKKEDKRTKTKVKEPRQVEKIIPDDSVEVAVTTGGGGGEGEGEGPGIGPSGGGGGGTCDPLTDANQCLIAKSDVCGDGVVQGAEQCDDGNNTNGDKCSSLCKIEVPTQTTLLPPNIFAGMRISGDTQIVPPDPVKTEMLRSGKDRTTGSFKICIDTSGRVSSISPLGGGTKFPTYDSKITTAMRSWRYKPYSVNNQGVVTPVPACSVVTFVYTIK